MHFLLPPGMMRGSGGSNLRSPSRESIASDYSVMSMSSMFPNTENGGGGGDSVSHVSHRRRRHNFLTRSRDMLNRGHDLNVSFDVPLLMTRQPEKFAIPAGNSSPHHPGYAGLSRSFSFSDMRSTLPTQPEVFLVDGPTALSDPSLSVNSDFDDEISMFFDDRGEPNNFRGGVGDEREEDEEVDPVIHPTAVPAPLQTQLSVANKHSKLRQRIKRKFLNFSIQELLHRRKSKKSPGPVVHAPHSAGTSPSASPLPDGKKSAHRKSSSASPEANLYPDQSNSRTLTSTDIEREQGRALSKYSRNLMIFNWLHNTEEAWFNNQMQ